MSESPMFSIGLGVGIGIGIEGVTVKLTRMGVGAKTNSTRSSASRPHSGGVIRSR